MFQMPPPTRDYRLHMPSDRWVKAACEDVGCGNWMNGWESPVDESVPLGRLLVADIYRSGRTVAGTYKALAENTPFSALFPAGTLLTIFVFEPGQRCFAEHRTRPGRVVVTETAGLRTSLVRSHAYVSDWLEDAQEHVARIEEAKQKG